MKGTMAFAAGMLAMYVLKPQIQGIINSIKGGGSQAAYARSYYNVVPYRHRY